MEAMKILKQMAPEVEKLFKDKNFASFATMMGDCAPQVTPVWVDYDQGNILINTAEGRTKTRNVAKNPNVAVCVTDSANPYTHVSVRGRIIEKTNQGADEQIDRMAKKNLGLDKYPFRQPGEKRVLLKIRPDSVMFMSP
jgi:PPOX class probable F420-dependent enzyme